MVLHCYFTVSCDELNNEMLIKKSDHAILVCSSNAIWILLFFLGTATKKGLSLPVT